MGHRKGTRSTERVRRHTPDLLSTTVDFDRTNLSFRASANETIQVVVKRPDSPARGDDLNMSIPLQAPLRGMRNYKSVASIYLDLKNAVRVNGYLVRRAVTRIDA